MILAIDIGNTTVTLALIQGRRVARVRAIEIGIAQANLRAALAMILRRVKRKCPRLEKVILCSVVPKVRDIVERECVLHLRMRPVIVGRDIKVPVRNNYKKPGQVGADRLVTAYAARELYGPPAIIIDSGTAITFDVISKKGAYEGGIIVPGIRLSAESLYRKTALLPKISTIRGPHALIGKDTRESILSGLFHGYGAMANGLIDNIAKKIGGRPRVILTGGYTQYIKRYIKPKNVIIDRDLVFKGMALLLDRKKPS